MLRFFCDRCGCEIDDYLRGTSDALDFASLSYDNKGKLFISKRIYFCYDCQTKYIDFCEGKEIKAVDKINFSFFKK